MSAPERSHLLIGIHPVEAALRRSPDRVEVVWVTEGCRNARVLALLDSARAQGVTVRPGSRADLDRRSGGQRHQDVLAEFRPGNLHSERDLEALIGRIEGKPLVLVLDGVQDPHNLGACLRTADAAGADLVVLPKDRAAGLTPVARRAAAGAAEVLPIVVATNLARALRQLKEQGVWLTGTSDSAERGLYEADLSGPLGLVLGSEGQGMRRLTAEHCDFLVRIPMHGTVSSLNVSVAAGVCLFEIARQRGLA